MFLDILFSYYDEDKKQYVNPIDNFIKGLFELNPFTLFLILILLDLSLRRSTVAHQFEHTHRYYGTTSCSNFHFHDCEGRTDRGFSQGSSHAHKIKNISIENPKHSHKIPELTTGPAIPYENRAHYHEFVDTTPYHEDHDHMLTGETSLA